jgi:hypothetical protein
LSRERANDPPVVSTLKAGGDVGCRKRRAFCDVTFTDAIAELSGFAWKAMSAKSAPLVPPLRQMPLP